MMNRCSPVIQHKINQSRPIEVPRLFQQLENGGARRQTMGCACCYENWNETNDVKRNGRVQLVMQWIQLIEVDWQIRYKCIQENWECACLGRSNNRMSITMAFRCKSVLTAELEAVIMDWRTSATKKAQVYIIISHPQSIRSSNFTDVVLNLCSWLNLLDCTLDALLITTVQRSQPFNARIYSIQFWPLCLMAASWLSWTRAGHMSNVTGPCLS